MFWQLGSEKCKVLGAYGRDTPNDSGERLLSYSANCGLALLKNVLAILPFFVANEKTRKKGFKNVKIPWSKKRGARL